MLEEIEMEEESPRREVSTHANRSMEESQSAPMDARRRDELQKERNPREESLEINWRSREPSEKRISNEELELKIVESEDRVKLY